MTSIEEKQICNIQYPDDLKIGKNKKELRKHYFVEISTNLRKFENINEVHEFDKMMRGAGM